MAHQLISVKDQDGFARIIDMVPDIVNKFTNKEDDTIDDEDVVE